MALPSFTLTGNLKEILGDVEGGELVESALTQAVVQLQSNIPDDALVTWDGVAYVVDPVVAQVDSNGDILNEDGDPLTLLAQDDGLSITGLQWRINITIPTSVTPSSPSRKLRPWWIEAGVDGATVDLAVVAPVPGASAHPIADALTQTSLMTLLLDSGSDFREELDTLYVGGGGSDEILEYANFAAFPVTGATNFIYLALDTDKFYRWTGSTYQLTSDTDVAAVAHAASSKTTPVDADELPLVDSAASNGLKKLTWANLKAGIKSYYDSVASSMTNKNLASGTNTFPTFNQNTSGNAATATALATSRNIDGQAFNGTADITVIAPGTHAATGKTTPVDADELALVDSAASNVLKKLTWANVKAAIKSYYDSVTTTMTNKTVDVDNNTVSNIEVDNFKGSAIVTASEGLASSINDTSLPTVAATKAYVDATIRSPLNNRTVVIGDSITEWLSAGYLMQPLKADMFFNHICLDSYQRIKNAGYFAKGGWTLAQIQSDYLPTVLAMSPAPGACLIEGGLNDITLGTTFASSVSTLKAMVASLLAKGIWPILTTLPPMSFLSHQANVIAWNDWIRRYAAINGFGLIDFYAALAQTDGTYIPAYDNGDTVHMSVAGHAAMARKALTDGLAEYFPPNQAALTARSSADVTNLFSASGLNRGLFTTNTAGVGTGLAQGGSTALMSIIAPTTAQDLRGNWQRMTRTTGNTGSGFASVALSSGWSVGDTLALSFRVNAVGFEAANTGWNCYATQTCSSYSTPAGNVTFITAGPVGWKTDHEGLECVEWVVPAGSSSLTLVLGIDAVGGTGTPSLDIGELTVKNLTTGNLMQ